MAFQSTETTQRSCPGCCSPMRQDSKTGPYYCSDPNCSYHWKTNKRALATPDIPVEAIEAAAKIVNARITIGEVITDTQCRNLILDIAFQLENPNYEWTREEWEAEVLLQQVNDLISGYGCVATHLGSEAVGVMGDARYVGVSVLIDFPDGMDHNTIGRISNEITNKVRGIARVLMNIRPHPDHQT